MTQAARRGASRCTGGGASVAVETGTLRASRPGGGMVVRPGAEKMTPRERAAAPKSRGEKSRPPTVAAARAAAGPGRLPEAEWLYLLGARRADRDVGDIIAELMGRLLDECSKAHAAQQCVPFAVGQARDALLHAVQWRFLMRDEGDTGHERDGIWQEDEEPEPCTVDSWAQGSVPVLHAHHSLGEGKVSGARAACEHGRQDPSPAPNTGSPPMQPLCPGQVPSACAILPVPVPCHLEPPQDKAAVSSQPPKGKPPRAWPLPRPAPLARPPAPCPPSGLAKTPGQLEPGWCLLQSPHRDTVGSSVMRASSHTSPLSRPSCTSLVTIWPGRPLHSTGVKQEGSGTMLGVHRLGPGSRPEHWIKPQVEVLDLDLGAEAKLPACPCGGGWHSQALELGSLQLPWGLATVGRGWLQLLPPGSPQPPGPVPRQLGSLLDPAWLAPGVTVRWGGSVIHRVCIPAHGEEEDEDGDEMGEAKWDLRPICPTLPFPAIVAEQVMGDGEC
ncbi:uncharacterized protein C2orf81 homolog [Falco peregrinus]|uniref:uncharacterized protein C2orf81 homolog n=1 Tax=Falco peregrinus TaxID=8954 RepID=UPI00247908D0|nr:uncharacterized protein C2orf81 homolog [Falco peregrinus]